ncbi:ATP-binding protein [Streptomyces sp. NRRL WC-3719]|uniref:ATP-binding protein n=1 Tax=Streptomyces sp. NRRL WC-3719 TaxID=1463932 RepID=UPI003B63DC6A
MPSPSVILNRAPERGRPLAESGYGLLLVGELADRWGVRQGPVPCKTVWAELDPVAVGWPSGQA